MDTDSIDSDISNSALNDDFVMELSRLIDGDVRFDQYTRALYATDASIYRVVPIGVVFPKTADDVIKVCRWAHSRGVPILPRGAGTSLAGQAVNEAIVLDFSRYMNRVASIDSGARTAVVQPGVVLADLNRQLAPYDLKFAPDPSSANRSTIGGAIGNNASGAHSLVYGMTDRYVRSVDVVLDDGTLVTFSETPLSHLPEKMQRPGREGEIYRTVHHIVTTYGDEIKRRTPPVQRNASGYNLARLIQGDSINLSRLMVGSEGTLGIVVQATIGLEPLPKHSSLVLLSYELLTDAMKDVPALIATGAAAVEVMDDVMLRLAARTSEFADVVRSLPQGTSSVLIIEYYGNTHDEVARLADATVRRFVFDRGGSGRASAALQPNQNNDRKRIWAMRAAGVPILLSRTSDEKHIPFVEDAAIPPERLADYVEDFQALLKTHGTYASFYAHAGPGVLHVRPLISTKTAEDLERMRSIAAGVADLVLKYNGALSGEHGDGRSRTPFNRLLHGDALWQAFLQIKEIFDPRWILNPGQVVFRDDAPTELTAHLRHGPDVNNHADFSLTPTLKWRGDNGFQGMVELCHGCAGCRTLDGGVMCPTYRATQDEMLTTRGRANLLREAIQGFLPARELYSPRFQKEVLDLCIGCKGCKRDCPSQVDMAKLKMEMKHQYHQKAGISLRERLFSRLDRLSRWGSAMAPISNVMPQLPGSRLLLDRLMGITRQRPLPRYSRHTLETWFKHRRSTVDPTRATAKVKFFIDCHTNYHFPEVGRASVQLLEAADVYVEAAPLYCCGRPALSMGRLDVARSQATQVVETLRTSVKEGWDVVGVEPSCMTAMQDEYGDLFDIPPSLTRNVYEIMEYMDGLRVRGMLPHMTDTADIADKTEITAPKLLYHGHCHQKALKKEDHAYELLTYAGLDVQALDSSCCGMAGSFGYETEHYELSMAIGRLLFEKIRSHENTCESVKVVAPGASCGAQIAHGMGIEVFHPAVVLLDWVNSRQVEGSSLIHLRSDASNR